MIAIALKIKTRLSDISSGSLYKFDLYCNKSVMYGVLLLRTKAIVALIIYSAMGG